MSTQSTSDALARVRIPSELSRELDRFYSTLKIQTLEAAVLRAAGRSDGVVTVQHEDISECLREVLKSSFSNFSLVFPGVETSHVKIAS
jgi:histone H3/H4